MQNFTFNFFNQISVYRGSKLPLINRKFISAAYVHGTDGLGDVFSPDDVPPQAPLKQEHAVDALIRLAEEHKGLKGAVHVSTYGMFLIVNITVCVFFRSFGSCVFGSTDQYRSCNSNERKL